jgi:hypothetical protein
MNLKKILLGTLVLCSSCFAIAQENYTVKMKLKIEGLPPEYAAMGEQDITTFIRGNQHKSEMNGMMGSMIVYYDGKLMTSLSDQMGMKTGFTATKEELDADEKERKTEAKPKIEYKDEKQTIAGYACKKAIVTNVNKQGKEEKTTVWYTEDIKTMRPPSRGGRGMVDLGDLKGYPLSMEMVRDNQGTEMKSSITATEIKTEPLDDAVFVVNTAGYKMMSYKEMKEAQKAGMGMGPR